MPPPSRTDHLPTSHPAQRQRPKSPNRVLAETEAQWIFTEAELDNTPSVQDGMSVGEEREIRAKGVNFIVQVGIMLKLPQLTLSTAAVFFQRFLMRASLKKARDTIPKLHQYQSAATALFLATKVEESCRKMKEMIIAFCRVAQKNPNMVVDEQSKDYWRWRDCILFNEDVLLETLCFDLTVESPHRQLFDMLKYYGVEHNKRLRNAAWAFVTDSNNTQLCLLHSSRTIAVAGMYAACRYCEIQLPDDSKGRPWWATQHVRLKDVRRAVDYMCANYESATNKLNGPAGSQDSMGGARSIYVGLSTPANGTDGATDDWDSTRLRQDEQGNSPFLPPPSERRASNASSIGMKRDREDGQPAPTSGGGINGAIPEDGELESKRVKLDDTKTPTNGLPQEPDPYATGDQKLEEERMKIRHGNEQAEADVKAADQQHQPPPPPPAPQPIDGSQGFDANGRPAVNDIDRVPTAAAPVDFPAEVEDGELPDAVADDEQQGSTGNLLDNLAEPGVDEESDRAKANQAANAGEGSEEGEVEE
ncbi:cyclin-like protein [Hortaea werneckii]|nr:cyclin-like protein [Hortaea werneckii]